MTVQPVAVDAPGCVQTGNPFSVSVAGMPADAFEAEIARGHGRFRVDRGEHVGGLQFRAADRPGPLTVTLDVDHGGTWVAVDVATLEVTDEACAVRMTAEGAPLSATFELGRPTRTDIRADGARMLVDLPYTYVDDRGWKRLDLRDLDAVMGLVGGFGASFGPRAPFRGGAFDAVVQGDADLAAVTLGLKSAASYNLPQVLFVFLDHERLIGFVRSDRLDATRARVRCRDSDGRCDRITLGTPRGDIVVDYDNQDRVVGATAGRQRFRFEYGDFTVMEPPRTFEVLDLVP